MPFDSRQWLDRYQPYRRAFEAGFWIVFYCLQAAANTAIVRMDIARVELRGFAPWQPLAWEWSSNLVLLALVPLLLVFDRRFPLHLGAPRRHVLWHVVGTFAYSALHVSAMVGVRKAVYAAQGLHYDFGPWLSEYGYEYMKDIRSYAGTLVVIYLYRLLLLRMQGEARLLDPAPADTLQVEAPSATAAANDTIQEAPADRPERFLVRMLGKEFLISAADIECLQASGNYVNLRVRGRDYPLRSTVAALAPRLDPARFVRVHRSWLVNLDFLVEIEPLETGDARLTLRDGTRVPCSRTYRAALRGDATRETSPASASA
ncbi:MAG: LytTR family DNA-binding domain-containing protein [Arenimonas sp.]